jgi:predicted lactoylglutathione lyase
VLDHLTLRVADLAASGTFYETVLSAIGHGPPTPGGRLHRWEEFMIASASRERPATHAAHIGFGTRSREDVDAFWRAGTEAGYASDGEPGPRPEYGDEYYGSFLLDPDGNSAEAVWLGRPHPGPFVIDHVWLRVAELGEARRFYRAVAPTLGLGVGGEHPERFSVRGRDQSLALVHDERPVSEHVHIAFRADTNETVHAFHRAALAAGFTSNGAPGERPQYHAGYYAAFVLDADGNNVEAVNHNR